MGLSEGVQKDLAMCKMQRAQQKRVPPMISTNLFWSEVQFSYFFTTKLHRSLGTDLVTPLT